MLLNILIIIFTVLLDQVTKFLTLEKLTEVDTFPLIENVLHFTYVENRGAAFGMLSDHRWVFMTLSVIGIALVFAYLAYTKPKSWWARLSLCFIIGGGIGNMIDRAARGFVVDMIDFRAFDFWKWVFNVADSFVCVGCGMFIIAMFIEEYQAAKAKKSAEVALENAEKVEEDSEKSAEDGENGDSDE